MPRWRNWYDVAGLKHQWIHFHAGSIPALGTEVEKLD